jgi:hypothetical protein
MKKKLDENDGPKKKKKRGKKNSNYCGATEEQVENIEDCSTDRETEYKRSSRWKEKTETFSRQAATQEELVLPSGSWDQPFLSVVGGLQLVIFTP